MLRTTRRSELAAVAVTVALRLRRRLRQLATAPPPDLHAQLVRVTAALVLGVATIGAAAAFSGAQRPLHAREIAIAARPTAAPPPTIATSTPSSPDPAPAAAAADPAPAAPPAPDPVPAAAPAPTGPQLPSGKGMWIWEPDQVEGGDVNAIVAKATADGIHDLYVRTGSSVDGFNNGWFLDELLGPAHAAGLVVYGWDFPYLTDPAGDVARAVQAITHVTPDGQRLDGFSADIETPFEGVALALDTVSAYGDGLRAQVGPGYPLIATVPRPSDVMQAIYPYAQVVAPFDVIAPMVYWLNGQPDTDVAQAVDYLSQFGKPVAPIGQAYDGGPEGGRPGPPTPDEINRFMTTAAAHGASSVSFWSWQHADPTVWAAIADSPLFVLQQP